MLKKDKYPNINNFDTSYQRNYEESEFFSFTNPVIISTGSTWLIDIKKQKPEAVKFLPMTNMRVVNNSNQPISIHPNQHGSGMVIPAGGIITFDRKTIPAINDLLITNLSASVDVAVGEIIVDFWREGIVMDQAFKQMHKFFYKFVSRRD